MNSSKIMLLEAKIGYAQLFCNALPDLQCNIPVMVIFGHFHFQFSSSQATIHGHNEFSAKACPCFDVKKELT